ncbi:MAG: membrane protein insertion efficiency factor YidD [Elusimicrobia bacterium]|jgi:putative membrane protein insertion efficiency factor|nr:membrane protein insertion efficiency factor YidD [Elusimicrobiota bacterium]
MEKSRNYREKSLIADLGINLIKLYQIAVSPFFSSRCRFYPSCSHYFIRSLQVKGAMRGSLAGIWRIIRCNPFNAGGYDPVDKE